MRIAYLDRARAAAIIMVVWIHTWDTFVIRSPYISTLTGWSVHQLAHTIGRYGVPLFVMLTGALMLGRIYPNMKDFFEAKIPRFIGALVVASILYTLLVHLLFGESFATAISKFLLGKPIGGYHLWYLYMAIGLYFAVPFLARLLQGLSEKEVRYLLIISIALVFVPLTISRAGFGHSYLPAQGFILQLYAIYAIAGYWLHKHRGLQSFNVAVRIIILLATVVVTLIAKIAIDYQPEKGIPADGITWYDSVLIFTASCVLFSLIRDMTGERYMPSAFVRTLATSSFSIYLWHLAVVHIATYARSKTGADPFVMVVLTVPLGIALGWAIYAALHRSPVNWLVR